MFGVFLFGWLCPLSFGFWLLASGFWLWLLAFGFALLAPGFALLASGFWLPLAFGLWLPASGFAAVGLGAILHEFSSLFAWICCICYISFLFCP